MTDDEFNAQSEILFAYLQAKFPPAEAMMILTRLNAKALLAATPKTFNALDKSCRIFFETVVEVIGHYAKKETMQ